MTGHIGEKPLVLCVDDNQWVLNLTRDALESKGFRVLTAGDGQSALQIFSVSPVEAVVLDFEMPGMNGDEVARCMDRIKPNVPKLLFSGKDSFSKEERGIFQGICNKPSGVRVLIAQLTAITSREADDLTWSPIWKGAKRATLSH